MDAVPTAVQGGSQVHAVSHGRPESPTPHRTTGGPVEALPATHCQPMETTSISSVSPFNLTVRGDESRTPGRRATAWQPATISFPPGQAGDPGRLVNALPLVIAVHARCLRLVNPCSRRCRTSARWMATAQAMARWVARRTRRTRPRSGSPPRRRCAGRETAASRRANARGGPTLRRPSPHPKTCLRARETEPSGAGAKEGPRRPRAA